jgi:molybdopterin converting factor small subunit
MKRPAAKAPAAQASAVPFTVTVELISYVNDMVDAPGQKEFTEEARPGDTVRTLLRRFSSRYPRLNEAMWEPGSDELTAHIDIILNDALLGASGAVDTPVRAHDRILLTGQFVGG